MVNMRAVWARTAAFLSERAGMLAPFTLAVIWVPTVVAALIPPLAAERGTAVQVAVILAGLALSILAYWGRSVVMTAAMAPEQGMAARRLAIRRFPVLIGVMLLLGIVLIVAVSPVFLILMMYGVDPAVFVGASDQLIPADAAMMAGGYFLLLIPILLTLGARLVLVAPVVIAEGMGIGAINRSATLTRGMTGRLIGMILLYAAVALLTTLGVTDGLGRVLIPALGGDGPWAPGVLATLVLLALAETLLGVVAATFVGKLYLAAVARQHRTDAAAAA